MSGKNLYCGLFIANNRYSAKFSYKDLSLTDADAINSWIIPDNIGESICDFLVKVNNFGETDSSGVVSGIEKIIKSDKE